MNLRRAIVIAACLLPAATAPVAAQSPWPAAPGQSTPSASPQPSQPAPSPWSQRPAEPSVCIKEFTKLRNAAEKRGEAIKAATSNNKRLTAPEACRLFSSFSAAEAKMVKYAKAKASECGIPPKILQNMAQAHAQTVTVRTNACRAAQAQRQQRPAGPSLSDALSAPIPNSDNIKSGGGTFDTLTGTPLGR